MKTNFISFLTSSWFWAVLPALALSLFLPEPGKRYTIDLESKKEPLFNVSYADLNGDSFSEKIFSQKGPPLNRFPVTSYEGKYYEQWNLPDELVPGISETYTGNYDDDVYAEIYVFTVNGDSVFLNADEILDRKGIKLQRIFITRLNLLNGHIDSILKPFGFFDQNGDGKKELYFAILSGYSLEPRQVYYYDLANQQLKTSRVTGVNFNDPRLEDIDGDGRPEITGFITASGNHRTPMPYSDHSAWLMILDDNLELKFPPVEFPGFTGSLETFCFGAGSEKKLFGVYNYMGSSDSVRYESGIYVFTPQGERVQHRTFNELSFEANHRAVHLKHGASDWLVFAEKSLVALNEDLEVVKNEPLDYPKPELVLPADINQDGQDELLLFNNTHRLLSIYTNDLKLLNEIPFEAESGKWQMSPVTTRSGEKMLFIKSGENAHFLQFRENPYYLFTYLVYPGVYLAFVAFIGFIKQVTTRQVEKQEEMKRKLQSLQLRSIKSQLDPHFMFNALNSVASLLYREERNAAYDYLNKFTRLLRQLLNDAERIYRTLEEEIEFVEAYLKLEKLRFGDKFDYSISIDEGITRHELVPVMVLQTFAENAIKHGLMPLKAGGRLTITVEKQEDYLKLTIEDNGIGRQKAAERVTDHGKGLKMISEFYEILNRDNRKPIQYAIHDLHDAQGTPSGTRVEILVPMDIALK